MQKYRGLYISFNLRKKPKHYRLISATCLGISLGFTTFQVKKSTWCNAKCRNAV